MEGELYTSASVGCEPCGSGATSVDQSCNRRHSSSGVKVADHNTRYAQGYPRTEVQKGGTGRAAAKREKHESTLHGVYRLAKASIYFGKIIR